MKETVIQLWQKAKTYSQLITENKKTAIIAVIAIIVIIGIFS